MSVDCDVVVVGAGLSGLVVARELQAAGRDVRVIEASPRAGGVIQSRVRDGALYELGPNSTQDSAPTLRRLIADLGLTPERIETSEAAQRRYVLRDGRLVPLPASPPGLLSTPLFSLRAKLRLLREPFVPRSPGVGDESITAFVSRRLGREVLDYAAEPFVAGVYAGNPDELSMGAAFPRLAALEREHGSLMRGALHRRRTQPPQDTPRRTASFSFHNGMEALPQALVATLRDIRYRASALALRFGDGGCELTVDDDGCRGLLRSRAVVVCVPAFAAAPLVMPVCGPAAEALNAIRYAPVLSIAGLYRRADVAHRLDGFGFLVPRAERRRILGTLFSSSMFAARAPAGHVLLTTFAGGRRDAAIASLSDEEVAAVVADELSTLLGAVAPRWQQVTRWERAIPQYTIGHAERVEVVERMEHDTPGIFFAASWRGGVSVADCAQNAVATARHVDEHLGGRSALSSSR